MIAKERPTAARCRRRLVVPDFCSTVLLVLLTVTTGTVRDRPAQLLSSLSSSPTRATPCSSGPMSRLPSIRTAFERDVVSVGGDTGTYATGEPADRVLSPQVMLTGFLSLDETGIELPVSATESLR